MSVIRQEIQRCMSDWKSGSGSQIYASFEFPKSFIGFQGHFPDRPVVPGVCLVQSVVIMLEKWHGGPVRLKEISNAKFYAPATSGEVLEVVCGVREKTDTQIRADAVVTHNGKKIAEIRLTGHCF
jgi:3-hydroxymyristoyl/3-hydroxydecanoyl-(acyl carrier protein) dehydratase